MTIRIKCTHCGKALQTPDAAAGKRVKCPGCGAVLTVPAQAMAGPVSPASASAASAAGQDVSQPGPTSGGAKPKKSGLLIGGAVTVLAICAMGAWLLISHRSGGTDPRTEEQLVEMYRNYADAKDVSAIVSLTCHDGSPADMIAEYKEHVPDLLKQTIKAVRIEPIPADEKADMMRGNVLDGKLYLPNIEPVSRMVVEYETSGSADGQMTQSIAPIGRKGKACYFVGTKVVDAPAAQGVTDPMLRGLLAKTLVLVAETGDAITDVQVLDAIPTDDIEFKNDKGVVVTALGTALNGYDAGHPAAERISDSEKVTVFSDKGKLIFFGDTHRWGVPVDQAFLERVRRFLASPRPQQPPTAAASEKADGSSGGSSGDIIRDP